MLTGSASYQSFQQQYTQIEYLRSRFQEKLPESTVEAGSEDKLSNRADNEKAETYAPQVVSRVGDAEGSKTQAANNILNFISARLSQDFLEGATEEELQSRLEAGLEGFLKGYQEAYEQLSALGQLVPDVKTAVEKTYTDVLDGIEALAEHYGLSSPVTGEHRTLNNEDQSLEEKAAPVQAVAKRRVQAYEEYNASVDVYQSRSFNFSLKTQDGDTLKIGIQNAQSFGMSYDSMGAYSGQNLLLEQGLKASFIESGKFFVAVEGELDEGELKAIGDLLNKINDLAEDFYAGDIEQAFNEALELEFDSDEIMRFSLNLRMEQSVKVQESYTRFSDAQDALESAQNHRLMQVAKFVQMLEEVRLEAQERKIEDIAKLPQLVMLNEEKDHSGAVEFMTELLERLNSLSEAK